MKKRTFFLTLALFLLFFNSAILIMATTVWNDRLDAAKERCLAEQYTIAYSLYKDMQALDSRGQKIDGVLPELMDTYSRLKQDRQTDIALLKNGSPVYATFHFSDADTFKAPEGNRVAAVREEENLYLYVYGSLPSPFDANTLVYRYELTESLNSWRTLKNTLFFAGSLLSGLLALSLLFLLERLFRPLRQISLASSRISEGNYGDRLPVMGRDELAQMSESFNRMAVEIETQIGKLKEAAEQKQCFVDNLAHELRTPLTAIYGYAEYLQKAAVSEEDRYWATQFILSECSRIEGMSEQLLELAMLNHNEIEISDVLVDDLFSTAEAALSAKAASRGVQILRENSDLSLSGNRRLLECLLINLLDNAVKASEPNGVVRLCAQSKQNTISLSVADRGPGMTQEQLTHIKEAFYRVDKARSRKDGGAGLGLALCEQIASVHCAKLTFHSVVSEGTKATVTFTTSH